MVKLFKTLNFCVFFNTQVRIPFKFFSLPESATWVSSIRACDLSYPCSYFRWGQWEPRQPVTGHATSSQNHTEVPALWNLYLAPSLTFYFVDFFRLYCSFPITMATTTCLLLEAFLNCPSRRNPSTICGIIPFCLFSFYSDGHIFIKHLLCIHWALH